VKITPLLYDGWALAYAPNSPAALHLLALLQATLSPGTPGAAVMNTTRDDDGPIVALPAVSFHALPDGVRTILLPTEATPAGRLRWEQRRLPGLARPAGAGGLHQVGGGLPLWGGLPSLYSPSGFPAATNPSGERHAEGSAGLAARLRQALGQGGMARSRGVLWPADLPAPRLSTLRQLPPAVHPVFMAAGSGQAQPSRLLQLQADLELPDAYVLYHGPTDLAALRNLVDAWGWAAGPLAAQHPLLLVGLDQPAQERLNRLLAEARLTGTARGLPPLSLPDLAGLYHGCSAVFQPYWPAVDPPPWGDPLRMALAAGKPVAGLASAQAAAIAGPAAYLVEAGDYAASRRLLGAALITLLVEESMGEALGQAARQRAQAWDWGAFTAGLAELYEL